MPQQNASLSWIVTLVVFAFLVGVLVGVLLVNSFNPPGDLQVARPQAAPTTDQQMASHVPGVSRVPAPPQVEASVAGLLAGYASSIDTVNQALARLIEHVAELTDTLHRLTDAKIQLAQAEAQARAILAQADLNNKQQQAALDTAAQDRSLAHAERAALGMTLSVVAIEIVTMLMIGVLALIFVAVRLRLRQPPAPRAEHDRAYWLKMRLTAQENERAARRQHLPAKATAARSDRPYHALPLVMLDDKE